MHARIVRVPDVALIAGASVLGIALSLTGYYWDGWTAMPVAIRFATGLIAFGLSPGLLIAGPLVAGRSRTAGPADFIISVFTCSFSCNLIFNILLFVLESSFADLAHAYLVFQALGYVAWGGWVWRDRRGLVSVRERSTSIEISRTMLVAGLVLITAVTALTYIAYASGSPPVNPEELVSLRKLADNPIVRYDNISFRDGDPSTYLFVPFQVLIVGTSLVGRLDVVLTYSMFWAVATALSIGVITRLAFVMFGRGEVAAIMCLAMVTIGFFDPRSVIEEVGIVTPYPNRYGFGSGVLLPLGLLLFWSILRDPGTHIWRWALLTYLVVETTFVHARETLLGMGAMAVVFVLLAVRPRRHRTELVRIAGVLALMTGVLLAYRYVNLGLAPQLSAYVSGLSDASRDAAARMIEERGLWSALVTESPDPLTATIGSTTVDVNMARYFNLFVDTWLDSAGRLYLPLVLLVLPVYALRARAIAEASLAVVLAGLGIVTASGPLQLSLAAVVGNPEIFAAYNIIFIAALFVFGDVAYGTGAALAERSRPVRLGVPIVAGAAAGLLVASFAFARGILEWRDALGDGWTSRFAWLLLAATILAAAYRVLRRDLPLFTEEPSRPTQSLALMMAGCIVIAVMMPAIRGSVVWERNPFGPNFPPGRFTGDLLRDYSLLDASDKLEPVAYPLEVIRFLRDTLPPNQTVLSRDTLAVSLTTSHFAAIVTVGGYAPPSYIGNSEYLRRFARGEDAFAIAPYLADEPGRQTFTEMIKEFQVDVVIVDPAESANVRQSIDRNDDLRTMLQPVFEAKDFLVYRVVAASLIAGPGPCLDRRGGRGRSTASTSTGCRRLRPRSPSGGCPSPGLADA